MLNDAMVFSVSELNEYVSLTLAHDENLSQLRVIGEISGLKRHSSGHLYFTLKDETAAVSAVMFKQNAMRLRFRPENGQSIIIDGYASLYERDGRFQVYARSMNIQGEGALYKAFLAQKERLEKAGYFDIDHKKKIPFLPTCIGAVTSPTGAVIEDIRNVIERRFPGMPIRLYAVPVQGAGAAERIADGIRVLDAEGRCDVMIVGRGGGSMEDLWPFNETCVADAIYAANTPVISAVGHETDFSIADFTADLRAPTPSAAAELAVPIRDTLKKSVLEGGERLFRAFKNGIAEKQNRLRLSRLSLLAYSPARHIDPYRIRLDAEQESMRQASLRLLTARKQALLLNARALDAHDPNAALRRGYAYIETADGAAQIDSLHTGERIFIRMHGGRAEADVTKVEKEKGLGHGR